MPFLSLIPMYSDAPRHHHRVCTMTVCIHRDTMYVLERPPTHLSLPSAKPDDKCRKKEE